MIAWARSNASRPRSGASSGQRPSQRTSIIDAWAASSTAASARVGVAQERVHLGAELVDEREVALVSAGDGELGDARVEVAERTRAERDLARDPQDAPVRAVLRDALDLVCDAVDRTPPEREAKPHLPKAEVGRQDARLDRVHRGVARGEVSLERVLLGEQERRADERRIEIDREAQPAETLVAAAGLALQHAERLLRVGVGRRDVERALELVGRAREVADVPRLEGGREVRLGELGRAGERVGHAHVDEPLERAVGVVGEERFAQRRHREVRVRGREIGRARDAPRERLARLLERVGVGEPQVFPRAEVRRHDVLGRAGVALQHADLDAQLLGDAARDRLGGGERVVDPHLDAIAPELHAARRVEEPRGHAQQIALARHDAVDDDVGPEGAAHGERIAVLAEARRRARREHAEAARPRELIDELVGERVADVPVLGRTAVAERQHGERALFVRQRSARRARRARAARHGARRRERAPRRARLGEAAGAHGRRLDERVGRGERLRAERPELARDGRCAPRARRGIGRQEAGDDRREAGRHGRAIEELLRRRAARRERARQHLVERQPDGVDVDALVDARVRRLLRRHVRRRADRAEGEPPSPPRARARCRSR